MGCLEVKVFIGAFKGARIDIDMRIEGFVRKR